MGVERVAAESEIPEREARFFVVGGRDIAVARSGGQIYAFDDVCTHAGCSLSEGEVSGSTITCPCHQGAFDMSTGEVLDGPLPDPIETYPVEVSQGEIFVTLD